MSYPNPPNTTNNVPLHLLMQPMQSHGAIAPASAGDGILHPLLAPRPMPPQPHQHQQAASGTTLSAGGVSSDGGCGEVKVEERPAAAAGAHQQTPRDLKHEADQKPPQPQPQPQPQSQPQPQQPAGRKRAGNPAAAAAPRAPRPKKDKPPTAEQMRRAIGDQVKSCISLEKWTIAAQTQVAVRMDARAFDLLIKPNARRVTPDPALAPDAPVYVARLEGSSAIGEAFGKTKITGGSKYGTFTACKADVIWYPSKGYADIWWVMSGW